MVVEELVANVGFKVQGLGELRQFEDALKSVANLAKGLSGASGSGGSNSGFAGLSQKLQKIGAALDKFDVSAITGLAGRLRNDITTIKSASGSWAGIGNIAGQIVQRFGPGVAAVTQLVTELTQAGIEAATLRSRLQISAQGKGTSAAQLDALSRTYESMGLTAADAEKQFGSFASELNQSLDNGNIPDFLSNLGIDPRSGNERRDTAEVMKETLSALADRIAKNQEASARPQSAEESKRLADERDKLWKLIRSKFGEETLGIMKKGGGAAAWEQARKEGTSRRPSETEADREQNARVSAAAAKLQQQLGAFADASQRFAITIADNLLPPVIAVIDKVTWVAKKLGLLRETEEEQKAERERKVTELQRRDNVGAADVEYSGAVGLARKLWGTRETGAKEASAVVDAARLVDQAKHQLTFFAKTPEKRAEREENLRSSLQTLQNAIEVFRSVRPDAIRGISQDTIGRKAEVSNSDFANDQRVTSVTVTANYNEKDVATAVQRVVMASGANIPKGWNVATLGSSLTA
ncbi:MULTISPECIES: hypothetical protein [unclassified Beijerinckia]|uniref:hypothetical protein n=1 Tax=unclassified Beijerinckia TaxID=2638183 RepID=UPI000894366F|nr:MULTISPECIES: hypothetical protein [unclassified Beijerinckia]MDH7794123.1 hypothetical protein [Beijerinckia sp. GAS462]SEB53812.1 hypothetical protein SAMN05443249_0389 [Beijerinckia sp. 28-YEA-48]